MLLYQKQLYNKHNTPYYKCLNKDCRLFIRLDPISNQADPKHGHLELSKCEVDCLIAISKMKVETSSTRLNDDICSIYNGRITYLTTVYLKTLVSTFHPILSLERH
jgi:hypothetical protein